MNRFIQSLSRIVIFLVILQLLRIIVEQFIFLFITRTYYTDDIATMVAMLILTSVFLIIMHMKQIELSLFSHEHIWFSVIETLIMVALIISSIIILRMTLDNLLLLIYSSIVTPIFEEIIFRGYIWNEIRLILKKEWQTYIIVSILFALWHLGYVEGIAFRVTNNIFTIMIWKVVVGLCYGIVLGAVRMKTKNCYSTILLHGIMNLFGR